MAKDNFWFSQTAKQLPEVGKLKITLEEYDDLIADAEKNGTSVVGNEMRQRRDEVRLELDEALKRARFSYMHLSAEEIDALSAASVDDLIVTTAENATIAIDAIVQGFVQKLINALDMRNGSVSMLLSMGRDLDFLNELDGSGDPESPVKLLAKSSGVYYRGVDVDGTVLEFADRCKELDAFADGVLTSVKSALDAAVGETKSLIHDLHAFRDLEEPCDEIFDGK